MRPRDWSVLRTADPVPGDPEALRQLAQRYADTAEAVQRGVDGLGRLHDSGTVWDSAAGTAFSSRTGETARLLAAVAPRYTAAAQVLHRYAAELEQVQHDADVALLRARLAADERAADDPWRGWMPGDDPVEHAARMARLAQAEARLAAADRALQAAEAAWSDIGRTAAGALEEATSADDLDDGRWDPLAVVETVTAAAADLSVALGAAALVLAVVPGLQPFAGLAGVFSMATGVLSVTGQGVLLANDRVSGEEFLRSLAGTLVSVGAAGVARAATAPVRGVVGGAGAAGSAGAAAARPPALARLADGVSNGVSPVQALVTPSPRQADRRARRPERCPA